MNWQCIKVTRLIFCLSAISLALHAQAQASSARPRLVCLFLDLHSLDAADQIKARDGAIQFVEQVAAPSDVVEIMTYTSRLNVIQDFTTDHDSLVAALRAITPAAPGSQAGSNAAADARARLQALQDAVSSLSRFPDKKAMVYFSSPTPNPGLDDELRAALKDAVNAAVRANVSIYSPSSPGLLAQ
jgi:VWFA-related protein